MKNYKIYFILLILLPISLLAQSNSKITRIYYDKLPHIKIDKIVYYETPYTIVRSKPVETIYKPNWYWGYCAGFNPLAFENFVKEANIHYALDNQTPEVELEKFEQQFNTLKEEQFEVPYDYHYGDIYFTDKKTKKQYLMTMSYRFIKEFQNLDFSKLDTLKFKHPKVLEKGKNFKELSVNEAIVYLPTTSTYYTLENGTYKLGNLVNIVTNVLGEGNSKSFFKGNRFDEFCVMLRRVPNYIRSRVENGQRFFETVKQTPNGIVVIGKKRKQLNENESESNK